VHQGDLNGVAVCMMFNKIISGKNPPKYLSSDNDPLFKFHRWQANLRVLDVEEIKSVPYTPTSHPFIERIILTIRCELLEQLLFWDTYDLQNKLNVFRHYYNKDRAHSSLDSVAPAIKAGKNTTKVISIENYRWKSRVRNLYQLPIAA